MDLIAHNRAAWNRQAAEGGEWSTPVDAETIRRARAGDWSVVLTPNRAVPLAWFGDLAGTRVLCLASGGGQQAPVLAAAGAEVVCFDLAEAQLAKDAALAESESLTLSCVRGDMADLSVFADGSFDLVFHPVSNLFVPSVRPVWRECHRVLRPGGVLLAGFLNPAVFHFDHDEAAASGQLLVRHALPYGEPDSLSGAARNAWVDSGRAAEFSHSLSDQIGGQLEAGFVLTALYEDGWRDEAMLYNRFAPVAIATRAIKTT